MEPCFEMSGAGVRRQSPPRISSGSSLPCTDGLRILTPIAALFLAIPWIAVAQLDQAVPTSEQAAAGQALAEKWRDAVPPENAEYKGALKIRNRDGDTETVPLTFKIIRRETNWQTIYETGGTARRAAQRLVIVHEAGKPNEYYFAAATKPGEPAGQPLRLTNAPPTLPFAGSDFWLIDLGLEFFHWPSQRLLRTEMRKGQVAKVLESVNPRPAGGYARVVTWLEKESGAPILAEAYDANDKLLKQFSIKSVEKVKSQYQLQEMQISNPRTESRTRIEYDFEKR